MRLAYNKQNRETRPAYPDVDVVLTTRDLAHLFKKMKIDLAKEADYSPDILFAEYSGAGTIFGNTGGVMEAAVRTAYAVLTLFLCVHLFLGVYMFDDFKAMILHGKIPYEEAREMSPLWVQKEVIPISENKC